MKSNFLNSIILFHFLSVPCESIDKGYFSLCDVLPESTKWNKNNGLVLQSWLSSIIPSSGSFRNESYNLGGFKSDDRFGRVHELISTYGFLWRKYGEGIHDGWLYGTTDPKTNSFMKRSTYFIYPDFVTAIRGTFEGDVLRGGKETRVTHFRCRGGAIELKFDQIKANSTLYQYTRRTQSFISRHPTQRDPLEVRNVYIGPSPTFPNIAHQDALLAKRNLPPRSLIVYYSGTWLEISTPTSITFNNTIEEIESQLKNLIRFNRTHFIDVDPLHSDLRVYRATLGHKANHHFVGVNAKFCRVKHPVYGQILCLESIRHILRHEEILVNYSYDINYKFIPAWYKELYQNVGKDGS